EKLADRHTASRRSCFRNGGHSNHDAVAYGGKQGENGPHRRRSGRTIGRLSQAPSRVVDRTLSAISATDHSRRHHIALHARTSVRYASRQNPHHRGGRAGLAESHATLVWRGLHERAGQDFRASTTCDTSGFPSVFEIGRAH